MSTYHNASLILS